MGVVGSLPSPSPPPSSTANDTIETLYEKSMPSNDECSYFVMTKDEIDSNSNFTSNSDDQNKYNPSEYSNGKSPVNITYDSINVRMRRISVPTLATGRRSKFMELDGDAALKREIRRQRNREAARKLKEKQIRLEQKLQNDIQELETKEQELLLKIKNLESHREELEAQCKHIIVIHETLAQTADSRLKYIQRNRRRLNPNISIHRNNVYIKEEANPPSPQWQLSFSI